MTSFAPANPLSPVEEEAIHQNVLRILDEVGVRVENASLIERLVGCGARVDSRDPVVRFSPEFVEEFLVQSEHFDGATIAPTVSASVDVYLGAYLDPETDEFVPWDLDRLRRYVKLAHYLEHVSVGGLLGCPLADAPKPVHPLSSGQVSDRPETLDRKVSKGSGDLSVRGAAGSGDPRRAAFSVARWLMRLSRCTRSTSGTSAESWDSGSAARSGTCGSRRTFWRWVR